MTKTNEIELEEILCDGCEDFFQEEAAHDRRDRNKDDFDEYGTCCICENRENSEMEDTAIIQLNYKVESESGYVFSAEYKEGFGYVCIDCFGNKL